MSRLDLALWGGAMLAQVPDPSSEIGKWISSLGSLGLIGWLVWHTTSITIPRMVEAFRAESERDRIMLEAQRKEFLTELREQRQEFLAALGPCRDGARR